MNKAHYFSARDIWNMMKGLSLAWWPLVMAVIHNQGLFSALVERVWICRSQLPSGGLRRWGGTLQEKKPNPYRWFQGEGMEEGTGIVRDKIIVWTSVNAPSSYYIGEGYHPQHLLFQMLFKSRMPQGAFCEHGDCVSVRCALTICLGEGCTGNLAFCIFRLHLVSLHGWAPCSWSRSRLARNQNSKFLECFPLERECFQLEREWLLNLGTSRAK